MTICYLDPEDEITGAVARIRAVEQGRVVIVLSAGSRIATSRINFRLLAREASGRGLELVAVSDEPGVRALAISAGVPAYDSVAAAESARIEPRERDRRSGGSGEETRIMPAPVGLPAAPADDERLDTRSRRRRRRSALGPLIAMTLVVLLVGVAAYGAYLFVPTATITLRPNLSAVGPVSATVTADARVAVVDPGEGVVPAQTIELPLAVEGDFEATGTVVTTARATGSVRFTSENTLFDVLIPSRTRVATPGGVVFETTADVTVPRASFQSGPTSVDADVRAVRAGARGNVGAGTISVVPPDLADQLISVDNPRPTSGGSRQEQRVVTQEDYDAALVDLDAQLGEAMAAALADPGAVPRGLTIYPASAQVSAPVPSQPAAGLVDSAAEAFALGLSATASVLAVNEGLVDQVALEQLRALVPAGATVLEGTIAVSHAPGQVRGASVVYTASADAQAYRAPDREALLTEIRGQPASEARAIMEQYGTVELTVWPEFVDRVPDQQARINLTILPPTESP